MASQDEYQQQQFFKEKERKTNPYQLIWYKQGWSQTKVRKNNDKYWKFEIEHNGFRPN